MFDMKYVFFQQKYILLPVLRFRQLVAEDVFERQKPEI
jgi:hypothetical protein